MPWKRRRAEQGCRGDGAPCGTSELPLHACSSWPRKQTRRWERKSRRLDLLYCGGSLVSVCSGEGTFDARARSGFGIEASKLRTLNFATSHIFFHYKPLHHGSSSRGMVCGPYRWHSVPLRDHGHNIWPRRVAGEDLWAPADTSFALSSLDIHPAQLALTTRPYIHHHLNTVD